MYAGPRRPSTVAAWFSRTWYLTDVQKHRSCDCEKETLLNPSNYHMSVFMCVCVCLCVEYKYCAISWINYRIHNYSAYSLLPRKILHY
jgi:hypothetical protein